MGPIEFNFTNGKGGKLHVIGYFDEADVKVTSEAAYG